MVLLLSFDDSTPVIGPPRRLDAKINQVPQNSTMGFFFRVDVILSPKRRKLML